MELNEAAPSKDSNQKQGATNPAFEDSVNTDLDNNQDSPVGENGKLQEPKKRFLEKKFDIVFGKFEKHRTRFKYAFYSVLLAGYFVMVIAACALNFQRALALFVLTLAAIFFFCWDNLMARYEDKIVMFLQPPKKLLKKHWHWLKWVVYSALVLAVICWLVIDTAKQGTNQLISFGGLVMYIIIMCIFSKHPFRVSWRAVFWGLGLQFIFGLIILRTKAGFDAINWLGTQAEIFLGYTDAGSKFVFGDTFTDHFFAFKVLPIVVFFSTVISMLYYAGFMQWLILKVGFIMQVTMGTSPTESMVAAGNIFVGQTESPLLIRPYISDLTNSEIHAVMTGGYATIAGSVLGAYISFGIPASHLLTASVMSAPAALAIAKLSWPETEIPKITTKTRLKLEKGEGSNLLEAATLGASASILLVANIAVNLIAFLALLAFLNAALSWLGNMFDYPQLTFSLICSYVFMPFSFMMGVDWEDSFLGGELIGYKTFFNEFVAYEKLSVLIHKRLEGGPEFVDDVKQYLNVHSEIVATYALCGFANIGSLGILIGGLSSMAPERRGDIARCAIRALISGTVACFMTACVAGILYIPVVEHIPCTIFLENEFNSTSPRNSTQLLNCCFDLYDNYNSSVPSLGSLRNCCAMVNSTTFDCGPFLS